MLARFFKEKTVEPEKPYIRVGSLVEHKLMGWQGTVTNTWFSLEGAPCAVNFNVDGKLENHHVTYSELILLKANS